MYLGQEEREAEREVGRSASGNEDEVQTENDQQSDDEDDNRLSAANQHAIELQPGYPEEWKEIEDETT